MTDDLNDSWFWRRVLPFTDHIVFIEMIFFCLWATWSGVHGAWNMMTFHIVIALMLLWVTRRRFENARWLRQRVQELYAWHEIEAIDGQEGP